MNETPKAWKATNLEGLCDIDPEILGGETPGDYEFEYVDIASVEPNKISRQLSLERFRTAPSRARKRVRRDDVLMATVRPNLQAFAKVDRAGELIASTGFAVLRAKPEVSDAEFIKQILFSNDISRQIEGLVAGSNYPAINIGNVKKLRILAPPLEEQRRIASILSALDEQIEKTEAWIAKQQFILDGLIDELLITPVREETLSHYAEIGPRTNVSKVPDQVPFLPMDSVSEDGQVSRVDTKPWSSVSTGFTRFAGGDVLVAKITPCFENGKGAHVPSTAPIWTGSTEFHVIRAKPGVSQRWIYWITRAREFREKGAMQMTGSAGQQRVPRSFLETFPVRKASEKEQASIASTLDSIQWALITERTLLSKLRLNKQGLMADLLTGRVRVNKEGIPHD